MKSLIVINPGSEPYLDLEEFMNGRNGIRFDTGLLPAGPLAIH